MVAIDMISSLPDEVLTHILSFLNTKEAVHTCILSKRWRYLWASVPVLKFNLDEFWTSDPGVDSDEKERECEDKFERFVNGVLENRGPSRLDTFYYSWVNQNSYCDTSLEWLDLVLVLMPRAISVCIHRANWLDLPDSVFSCASLQHLYVSIHSANAETYLYPVSINLPSLKVLEVHAVDVTGDFTRKLFLGCPALESLILDDCVLDIFDITSDVLKELDINDVWLIQKMRISCLGLVSLSIQSSNPIGDISLGNMASLENAVIRLYADESDYYVLGDHLPSLDVLSGLSNATTIKLHFACLQLKVQLEKDIPRCRTFNNLRSLEIGEWDMTNEFDLVACFLEHSPNLQELTLLLNENSQGNKEEEPRKEVLFQREYLETVKIFCGNKDKLAKKLVKILKRHVKTIGIITIV